MVLLETRQGKYEEFRLSFFGGKKFFFCKTKKVAYLSGYIMYYISPPPSNISPSPPLKCKGSFQTYYHLIPWGFDTVPNPLD